MKVLGMLIGNSRYALDLDFLLAYSFLYHSYQIDLLSLCDLTTTKRR